MEGHTLTTWIKYNWNFNLVCNDTTIQCNPFRQVRSRPRVDIALVRPTPRLVNIIYTILVYCENALSFDTGITVEVARDTCFFRTSTWKEVFSGRKCSINFKSSFLVLPFIQVVHLSDDIFPAFIRQMSKSEFPFLIFLLAVILIFGRLLWRTCLFLLTWNYRIHVWPE